MKKRPPIPYRPWHVDKTQHFVMSIADKLSNDPALLSIIGPRFKVLANYDAEKRRVTYSFRHPDDTDPDEAGVQQV